MYIFRNVQRLGGALVLDYALPSTDIKSSNCISRIKREETRYTNTYDFWEQIFDIGYEDTPESWLTVLTNSLQIDHRWRNLEINTAFSHSYSQNILPVRISSSVGNTPINPFPPDRKSNYNVNLDPETIPDSLAISMDDVVKYMYLGSISRNESETRERDLAAELNLTYNINITDLINVKLGLGAKIRHKKKEFDKQAYSIQGEYYLDLVYDTFEDELS